MNPETQALLSYIDSSPTPYHAVAEATLQLMQAGFEELSLEEPWKLAPGAACFTVIDDATLIAFRVGSDPVGAGFRLVGAHTDSPNLRVKPKPDMDSQGFRRLGLEPYGGVQVATWVDRDLGVAGQATCFGEKGLENRRFRVQRPVCRVATLAIHLNREVNEKGLLLNKQTELPAIFGRSCGDEGSFRRFLAAELGVDRDAVVSFDAQLYDLTPSRVGGEKDEFIFAARLDNLASCHAGLRALIASRAAASTSVLLCFDNEEVGSLSERGADSPIILTTLRRILSATGNDGSQDAAMAVARSIMVSADMAHGVHPNFPDKHCGNHQPALGGGPVIKHNVNLRYATTSRTAAYFERLCLSRDVPVQKFSVRTDMACGSTIGPISAGMAGIKTVDVGNAMLSMHSIREMAGSEDHAQMVSVLAAHFENG